MTEHGDPPFFFHDFHPFPSKKNKQTIILPKNPRNRISQLKNMGEKLSFRVTKQRKKYTSKPDPLKKEIKKWNELKVECEETVEKVKELDEIIMDGCSEEPKLLYAITESAKIHARREEITAIVDTSTPCPEKRNILILLKKIRSFDEDSLIGKAMVAFDDTNTTSGVFQQIQEMKAKDLKEREIDVQNFMKAFQLTYLEMAFKDEYEKSPQPMIPQESLEAKPVEVVDL